jgi:Fic family protein
MPTGLLSRPNFYLSEYLEANRDEYYDRMLAVSRDDDWSGWVAFFLRGIIAQAEANTQKAQAILALHQDKRDWVETPIPNTRCALDWIFQRPIFQTPDFIASAQIPPATARKIIRDLRDNGLLRELVPPSGGTGDLLRVPGIAEYREGREAF